MDIQPGTYSLNLRLLEEIMIDAIGFVHLVKETFKDNPEIYRRFIQSLKDYRERRSPGEVLEVISRVKHLLEGHPALLVCFNIFVPIRHKIVLSGQLTSDKLRDLLKRIKMQFASDNQCFKSFAQSLKECGNGEKGIVQFFKELIVIFAGKEDLFSEFTRSMCNESFCVSD